ncbi:MAG: PIN domain-containing protein [Candidatus Palauibacterales bacterium]|nr:PIN domain-containing protein [Candidatus Palauibacterales bacterium]
MAAERALLDTSVLVAFLHADDQDHEVAVDAIRGFQGTLLATEAILTESMHLLGRTVGGPAACLTFFLRGGAMVVPSSRSSLARCRSLLEEYRDLPADFGDATLVALAEETETWTVLTLDRRDFSVYRGEDGQAFDVRPY